MFLPNSRRVGLKRTSYEYLMLWIDGQNVRKRVDSKVSRQALTFARGEILSVHGWDIFTEDPGVAYRFDMEKFIAEQGWRGPGGAAALEKHWQASAVRIRSANARRAIRDAS
jgi:hypothetical protein